MRPETWLPLVTLALGWAGGQATEAFKDRRAGKRDRGGRKADLQRGTLLSLQDTLLELFQQAEYAWYAIAALHPISEEGDPTIEYQDWEDREVLTSAASDTLEPIRAKAIVLASRIEDEEARRLAALFRSTNVIDANDDEEVADQVRARIIEHVTGR
jgi:hypothetical protein